MQGQCPKHVEMFILCMQELVSLGQNLWQCSAGSLTAPLGPPSSSPSPQHPGASATFFRGLCQLGASARPKADGSLAFLLVSVLRTLRMVLMSALINLHFGQREKDSGVSVDSPSTRHLRPEPFQHHQKHFLAIAPDLSHLASSTSSPKHHWSLASLIMFCLSFHLWDLQVTDTPLLPWIVSSGTESMF